MFWFNHPRQVGSRKAVAVQMVRRDASVPMDTRTLIVSAAPPAVGAAPAAVGAPAALAANARPDARAAGLPPTAPGPQAPS